MIGKCPRPVTSKKLDAFLIDVRKVLAKHRMTLTASKRTVPALSGPSCDVLVLKVAQGKCVTLLGADAL